MSADPIVCPLCAGTGYVFTLDMGVGWLPEPCPVGCDRPGRRAESDVRHDERVSQ